MTVFDGVETDYDVWERYRFQRTLLHVIADIPSWQGTPKFGSISPVLP